MNTSLFSTLSFGSVLLVAATSAAQAPPRQDFIDIMQAAATNYPSICQFVNLTQTYGAPQTHQGRDIFAVKISDNVAVDEDEEAFMMVCAHHGNEYGTPFVGVDTIQRLTEGYGVDPQITNLVDNREIWVAPIWNTDGYPNSRHNRRPGGTVDLNRNYPFLWASTCNTGVKGPFEASEPETQTMILWSLDQRFTKVLDFHSSGRETLWGYRQPCGNHVFGNYYLQEAIALSQNSSYGGAERGPSSNGEHYQWQLGTFSNYAFLTEISNTQSPTFASAKQEAARVWPGTLWMLERPIPVWGHVVDAVTGAPLEVQITYVENPFTFGEQNISEPKYGRYHAFIPNGNHTIRFSHPCYVDQDVPVTVTGNGLQVEVQMVPTCASCAFRNGTGVNATGFDCVNAPVLGTNWDTSITTNGTTVSTHLGLGVAPDLQAIAGGELLIGLVPSFFLPGNGSHQIAIPNSATLMGVGLFCQGFRVDNVGGTPTLVMLNAQDAVIGTP